jgi:lysophospholipase L1-like esterase
MKTSHLLVLLILSSPLAKAAEPGVIRENIEWCDVWMPNTNVHDLPRVLLIGDSITRGYYPLVEKELQGKAYVARLCTSKSVGDPALIRELTTFLADETFDVIHFNNGMHGWGYSEEVYGKAFPEVIAALHQAAPQAKLICCSITPVRQDKPPGATNARVKARNALAAAVAAKEGIPVDDLFALMDGKPELHSDDVHFGKEGQALQATQVAHSILPLLKK